MKTKLIKHIGLLVSAALSFSAVDTIVLSSDKPVQEVNAATDTWTNNGYQSDEYKYYSGNYYNATNVGDSAVSTGGTTLLSKLNKLIQPSSAYGYSNIWTFNEQYDCYPSNYNGTDSLTGNAYPTTDNTSKRGKMWDMYSDKTWSGSSQRAGSYSVVGDVYNREHSMPKSWFGGSENNQPGTDPNHLFNTDGKVNGLRSNFAFGEVSSANKTWTNGIQGAKATPFGLLGYSKTSGMTSVTVYEPDDAYKGDFARAQMYMATAYYDWNLTQDTNGGYCFTYSNNVSTMKTYYINLLTKWSNQDPVSQKEIDRNNAVYSKQGNRNPFIDHPGWANKIWGGTEYTWGKSSSTPTVNSVTVTPETLSLNLSGTTTGQLTATVSVSGGAAQTVNWSSSNTNVATVSSSGLVTAKAVGTTTITAKSTVDTTKSDTCTVTVSNTVTPSISVSASASSIAVNGTSKLTATTTNVTSPTITWSVTSGSSYVTLSSTSGSSITVTGKAAGSATIKASITVSGTTYSDSKSITVTSSGGGGDEEVFEKATSISEGEYLIVYETGGVAFNGGLSSLDAVSNTISVTISNNEIEATSATKAATFTFAPSSTSYTIKSKSGYYIGATGDSNGLNVSTSTKYTNTITFTDDDANIVGSGGAYLRYNSSSDQARFRYYKSSSYTNQKAIQLYKLTGSSGGSTSEKVLDSISATYTGEAIYVGDTLDQTAFTVTASYTDSTTYPDEIVTTGWTVSGFDSDEAGTNTVTITYEGKTCTVDLTILENDTPVVPTGDDGEASWTASAQGYTDKQVLSGTTSNIYSSNITVTFNKGPASTETQYYTNGTSVRTYGGSNFVVKSTKANIKKIVLTFGSSDGSNTITADSGSYSSGTWICSGTSYATSVKFSIASGSGNRRIAGITVSYYSASNFSQDFLTNITCNGGSTAPSVSNWNSMRDNKYSLLFDADKTTLAGATASESGTVIEKAMARYDFIIGKYNKQSVVYANYISRSGAGIIAHNPLSIDTSTATIIIIVTSMAAITIIGGALILKRKER